MGEVPRREPEIPETTPPQPRPAMLTSDIPEEWRAGRFVTLTVGSDVDLSETHPTEANPEARG
ncbi:hypothetical protein D3C86_401890 [compost metagenome]